MDKVGGLALHPRDGIFSNDPSKFSLYPRSIIQTFDLRSIPTWRGMDPVFIRPISRSKKKEKTKKFKLCQ